MTSEKSGTLLVAFVFACVAAISGCTSLDEERSSSEVRVRNGGAVRAQIASRRAHVDEAMRAAAAKQASPIKAIFGVGLGKRTDNFCGYYKRGEKSGVPGSFRAAFTPQRGLPQFGSYAYRCSIKSHRVFMVEAEMDGEVKPGSLLEEDVFRNFIKSLERKYGQTAKKEELGDWKDVRYTFYFPGEQRLVVEKHVSFTKADDTPSLAPLGGVAAVLGVMFDEATGAGRSVLKGTVSIVAYDDDALKTARMEERARKQQAAAATEARRKAWEMQKERKAADAAQAISDAL